MTFLSYFKFEQKNCIQRQKFVFLVNFWSFKVHCALKICLLIGLSKIINIISLDKSAVINIAKSQTIHKLITSKKSKKKKKSHFVNNVCGVKHVYSSLTYLNSFLLLNLSTIIYNKSICFHFLSFPNNGVIVLCERKGKNNSVILYHFSLLSRSSSDFRYV